MKKGYSVIEILVVVGVFAVIGILAAQSTSLSIRSTKKGDSTVLIKQELDYAATTIERLLQTSSQVIIPGGCTSTGTVIETVGFRDSLKHKGDLACRSFGSGDIAIASSSGEVQNFQRITSNKLKITNCNFICYTQNTNTYIDFNVTATAKEVPSPEGADVTTSRKILIRGSLKK